MKFQHPGRCGGELKRDRDMAFCDRCHYGGGLDVMVFKWSPSAYPALVDLMKFAALRSRREAGWKRLRVYEDPHGMHWSQDGYWSEFRNLDDMQCAIYLNSHPETMAYRRRDLECAKNILKRKQRQAGLCPGPSVNNYRLPKFQKV